MDVQEYLAQRRRTLPRRRRWVALKVGAAHFTVAMLCFLAGSVAREATVLYIALAFPASLLLMYEFPDGRYISAPLVTLLSSAGWGWIVSRLWIRQ
jgi:hypothetical protein